MSVVCIAQAGFVLAAVGALLLCAGASCAGTAYEEGLTLFQSGKFKEASLAFSRAVQAEPHSALARYYLANSLVKVGDHERAQKEYSASYMLDPHGQVSMFCQQALRGYRLPLPGTADAVAFRERLGTAGGARGTAEVQSSPAVENNQQVPDRAVLAIRRQLEQEKQKHRLSGESSVSTAMVRAREASRRIQMEAEIQIAKLYGQVNGRRLLSGFVDMDELRQQEAQIRNNAREMQEQVMRDAESESVRYRAWVREREQALEEVAANLESQMSGKGVRVQPLGTDFYVRYYGTSPNKTVPDARSAIVRIVPHQVQERSYDDRSQDGPIQPEEPSREVRGVVLQ